MAQIMRSVCPDVGPSYGAVLPMPARTLDDAAVPGSFPSPPCAPDAAGRSRGLPLRPAKVPTPVRLVRPALAPAAASSQVGAPCPDGAAPSQGSAQLRPPGIP